MLSQVEILDAFETVSSTRTDSYSVRLLTKTFVKILTNKLDVYEGIDERADETEVKIAKAKTRS